MNLSDAGKKGYAKTKHLLDAKREEKSRKAREKYEANPNICPTCGEVLPYEKRRNNFCSQSCAASHRNLGVVRVVTVNPEHCAHCGNIKESRQNKYCDACIAESVYNKSQSLAEIKSEEGRRSYLLRTRERRCEKCGRDEWNDLPIPIEVHHVDGNPDHNTEENLQLLCPNCHAQSDFFKGAAASKGTGRYSLRRQMRRKRYSEGKSW
jgi:HNH endonuclease